MLKFLQITFLLLLAVAISAFSSWRFFRGGAWWLAAIAPLIAYIALLSGFFLGDKDAWHGKAIRYIYNFALSNEVRAGLSLVFMLSITVILCTLAYRARPLDTSYFEVRVYEQVDLPGKYQVGTSVVLHTRTDGLTHRETVGDDGGALFRSVQAPTTFVYQLEVVGAEPPYMTGGSDKIDSLPDQLVIDTAEISLEKRQPITPYPIEPTIDVIPRPTSYLINVVERGDESLQAGNAPWGVPNADLIINRLGYVLGYDLERRMTKWVAYTIGPTEQRVPRTQKFVADPAIAADRQAKVSDYRGSGYDRGHMISPADLFFKGPVTVAEAFYMSTVTPQSPWLNRRLWRDLEVRVRRAVEYQQQPAYVISGPLFISPTQNEDFKFETIGDGQIPVPTHFFRIMAMVTQSGGVDVFGVIVPNAEQESLELENYLVSLNEIEQKSGLNFFSLLRPQIAERLKAEVGEIW